MKKVLKRSLAMFLALMMVFGAAPLSGFVGLDIPEWFDYSSIFKTKASAATSNVSLNASYSEATGNADTIPLPAGSNTFYYRESFWLNIQVGENIYIKDAYLYLYKDGSLHETYHYRDVFPKADVYFRYWTQPYEYADVGSYSFYYVLTYWYGSPSGSTGTYTTDTYYFDVIDRTPTINLSSSSVTLDAGEVKTVHVSTPTEVSYEYYWNFSSESDNISCGWGDWTPEGTCPIYIEGNRPCSNVPVTVRIKRSSDNAVMATATIYVTVNPYKLTYNANGGSGAPSSQTTDSSVVISSTVPKRFGYTFLGWSASSSATSPTYLPGSTINLTSNKTLYAVWKPATAVSLSTQYTATVDFPYQEIYYTFTPTASTRYVIESTGSTDSKVYVYHVSEKEIGNDDDSGDGNNFLLETDLVSGVKYYIKICAYSTKVGSIPFTIEKLTYDVRYDANGGTGAPSSQKKDYGSNLTLSTTVPKKTGYTFNGWNTEADGSGDSYASGGTYSENESVTLYAQWKLNTYTISYTLNGGTVSPANPTSYNVTTSSFTLNNPVKTGYTFAGWTGTGLSSATKTVTVAKGSTGNRSYTANWTANSATKYVVNHYQMNVSGSGYTLKETENKTGTTASSVTIANLKKTYTGFTFEGGKGTISATATKPSTLDTTTTVLADGTRVINLYYSRNKYTLSLSKGTGISAVTGAGTYYYEQSVTIDATVSNGYTWSKWSDNNTTQKATMTMPANSLTLTANATLNTYTISYTLNGGTVSPANPTSYNVTTSSFTLNNPIRSGYTFAGWTGTGLSSATKTVTVTKGSTGNRSYTANWTANSATKYVVNHYQMNVSGSGYTLKETENKTGTTASSVTIANLKKTYTGFTFEGGKGTTSATATKPSTLDTTTTVLADGTRVINLYYSRNKYTLSLSKGTGISAVTGAGTYYYEQSVTIDATVSNGYTWSKWSDNNTTKKATMTMPANSLTLTANATPNTYTIVFKGNGSTSGSMSNLTMTYGTAKNLTANSFVKTGHTFKGWNTKADGSGTAYSDKESVTNLTTTNGATITLYAQWKANTYTIVFNANGGSCSTKSKTVTYASTYGTLPTPTRSGYIFDGWYTQVSGGEKITSSTMVSITSDQTLYAHWTDEDVLVYFDERGGYCPEAGKTVKYGQPYGELPVPVLDGYGFIGWYTSADGGELVTESTIVTATDTHTLYAHWGPPEITYIIKYYNTKADSDPLPNQTVLLGVPFRIYSQVPTREGYTFECWYDVDTDTLKPINRYYPGQEYTLYSSDEWYEESKDVYQLSLVPSWIGNKYQITFNPNGGTVSPTSKTVTNGEEFGTLPTPVRPGYTFDGWRAEWSWKIVTADTKVDMSEDGELIAQWTANSATKYVVNHYQMNVSGSGYTLKETENKTGTTASSVTIANLKKTYTGFTFEGGKGVTSATATKPSSFDTTTTVLADGTRVINLYYSRNKYTLSLSKGTGISAVTGAGTYYYGQSVTINATVMSGYTWSKWSDNNTTKNATIAMPASALSLTANATPNTYTIVFKGNGSTSGSMSNLTMTYGTAKNLTANSFVKTGHTFKGWNTKADGSGTAYSDKESVTNLTTTNGATITLYAQWTEAVYNITFIDFRATENGPQIPNEEYVLESGTIKYKGKVVLPDDPMFGEGTTYTFEGWVDADGNEYKEGDVYTGTEDLVLYANYKKVAVKLVPLEGSTTVIERNGVRESYNDGTDRDGNAYTPVNGDPYETPGSFEDYYIYGIDFKQKDSTLPDDYFTVLGDGRIEIVHVSSKYSRAGTGSVINVYDRLGTEETTDDILVERFYIVIFGDVNGDAAANSLDASIIEEEALGVTSWSSWMSDSYQSYKLMAADLNYDSKIKSIDSSLIEHYALGVGEIDQVSGIATIYS